MFCSCEKTEKCKTATEIVEICRRCNMERELAEAQAEQKPDGGGLFGEE